MKDDLGKRMKQYEMASRHYLTRRIPVIIRIDGKCFHSFCKYLDKPFDAILTECMQLTLRDLCQNIQNTVFGYTQSDEITLVLIDYKNINTSAWFDNNIQKMTSVSASLATMYFNKNFINIVDNIPIPEFDIQSEYHSTLRLKFNNATFDSRVFNIPKDEVINNLIWRQQDATRNSIQSLGQGYFSANQLHDKSCSDIQDMLMNVYNVNWNDLPTHLKRGTACYKIQEEFIQNDNTVIRNKWFIDTNPPIFTQDREYIEKWLL